MTERSTANDGSAIDELIDWSALPKGALRTSLDVPSGLLAGVTMGPVDAETVVLVPGVTGSKEDFSRMMPDLCSAGYRLLSFDLAGQFESCGAGPEHLHPPREHYDYGLFVADLVTILESCGRPAHVVGYSFAGVVAQLALVRRPELFASLSLLSCPPQPGEGFRGVSRIGSLSTVSRGALVAALTLWGIRRNFNHVPEARLRFVLDRFRLTRRDSIDDVFELMKDIPDVRTRIRSASLPKLVAVGEHDVWPVRLHKQFAEEIQARFHSYPGGHSPCETSPHELAADLLALFRQA